MVVEEILSYSALDVAKYVIKHEHDKAREISNLRLQKLLYFVQAKVLVETDAPCFDDEIEAWDFGPVVPAVYYAYKIFGSWDIVIDDSVPFINKSVAAYIDSIVDYCKDYPTFQLVDITHKQSPWKNARQKGKKTIITKDSIAGYFKHNEK